MKDLIIIGAGGFGREVAWAVERINETVPSEVEKWNILGFLDDNIETKTADINGYIVLGVIADAVCYSDAYFVCAVGSSRIREELVLKLKSLLPEAKFATIIDPSVSLSAHVDIGEGSILCAKSVVTVNVIIGEHTIINLDCTVGHDAILHDFVTLYPSVNVSGHVTIEHTTEVGTGTQIIQGKKIGPCSIIGAGAVVINDISENCTSVGVPAKPV